MVVQMLAMVVAVVLRSVSPSEEEYRDFEQEEYEDKRAKTQRQVRGSGKSRAPAPVRRSAAGCGG